MSELIVNEECMTMCEPVAVLLACSPLGNADDEGKDACKLSLVSLNFVIMFYGLWAQCRNK